MGRRQCKQTSDAIGSSYTGGSKQQRIMLDHTKLETLEVSAEFASRKAAVP